MCNSLQMDPILTIARKNLTEQLVKYWCRIFNQLVLSIINHATQSNDRNIFVHHTQAITSVITLLMGPLSILFCGHYKSSEVRSSLSVVGCAVSVFNAFGMVFPIGMLTACETFFAQTFGTNDVRNMSIQFQRAILISIVICVPGVVFFLCIQPILLVLKQPPEIIYDVDEYLLYLLPGFFGSSLSLVFQKFLQAQNFVYGPLVVGVTGNLVNALLHYLLLFKFDIGLKGSAVAQSIAYWIQNLTYLILFFVYKFHRKYSFTLITEAFTEWGKWFSLAIPGFLMIAFEWWIFEVGTFIAGTYGPLQLAAQIVIFQVALLAFAALPFGFGIAASIRVGQALGSGNALGPISSKNVGITLCGCFAMGIILLCTVGRNYVPMVFSDNSQIIEYAAQVLPLLAVLQIFDAVQGVSAGVVRGAGVQLVGAVIGVIGLYVFALPLSIILMKFTDLKIQGYWISLCIGIGAEAVMFTIYLMRIDWQRQVKQAAQRCHVQENYKKNSLTIKGEGKSLKRIILEKLILLISLGVFIGVGIIVRCKVNLRQSFGVYCVYEDDAYIQFPWYSPEQEDLSLLPGNCTLLIP